MASLIEQFTALYTPLDIEYAQVMSGPYRDVSWKEDDVEVVVAFKDNRIMSGFWRPVVAFGDAEKQRSWIEGILCGQPSDVEIVYEDYLINGTLSPISRFLLSKGYVATPHYTQVIDLRKSVDELRHDLRKSYRSLVNKQEYVQLCGVNAFRIIHERVKGKTRCDESWQIQAKMDTVCVHDNGECGVMFYYGPVWAYYASAAGDNTHACIWTALLELKQRGVQFCEMGTQDYSGDPKAITISRFKAGYGGETKVRLILERDTSCCTK